MNRANQHLLFQATNQGLLGIRQSEINYYQSLNVAFGTQAALIGGFTYGVFSQNIINYDNGYASVEVLADVYWVCSAITIAFSVHVILCTMLMQVLGPGLALNGPVGSMARATEGMRIEQKQIIVSFILMMVTFATSTILSCWVVMTFEASVGCSVAFAVAACCWFKYCERIYLRFFWNDEDSGWDSKRMSNDLNDRDPTEKTMSPAQQLDQTIELVSKASFARKQIKKSKGVFRYVFNGGASNKSKSRQSSVNSDDGSNPPENNSGHGIKLISRILSSGVRSRNQSDASSSSDQSNTSQKRNNAWSAASASRGVVMEGYLTKRGGGTTHKFIDFGSEPWERRYFTLTNTCNIFIYKNRNDYRTDPKSPIYTRPLRLLDYYVVVRNMNESSVKFDSKSSVSDLQDTDSANPICFQMTLILRENVHNPNRDAADTGSTIVLGHSTNPIVTSTQDSSGKNSPLAGGAAAVAVAAKMQQQMYRDHWVLRCDTEEELMQWVGIIQELCPSCFDEFSAP